MTLGIVACTVDDGETRSWGFYATVGHYNNVIVIVEATNVDGRSCIGDTGESDLDGPSWTIGCKKETTAIVGGKNAVLVASEDCT